MAEQKHTELPTVEELTAEEQANYTLRVMRALWDILGKNAPAPLPQVFAWFSDKFLKHSEEDARLQDVTEVRKKVEAAYKEHLSSFPQESPLEEPATIAQEYQAYVFQICIAALYGAGHNLIKGGGSTKVMRQQALISRDCFEKAMMLWAQLNAKATLAIVTASLRAEPQPAPRAPQLVLPTMADVAAVNSGKGIGNKGLRG